MTGRQATPDVFASAGSASSGRDDVALVVGGARKLRVDAIRRDGGTQPRAAMDGDLVTEYAEAMETGATFPPVTVYYDGAVYWLADGFHRVTAVERLGWYEIPAEVRQGTRRDAVLASVGANATHGARRTNADKRRAVMALLEDDEWGRWSDREIGRRALVSNRFVSNLRAELLSVNGSQIEERRVERGGTEYTMKTANVGASKQEDAPEPDVEAEPDLTFWEVVEDTAEDEEPEEIEAEPVKRQEVASSMAVHYSSESPEWYTPEPVIGHVVNVLGTIDLDPCSNPGEPNVPAKVHYTEQDDGLAKTWRGRVYMNPPYGRAIEQWVVKLVDEHEAGNVSEAIALLPARTDTGWFRRLRSFPRCFITGRLSFSEQGTAPFPSVAVYLGFDLDRFVAEFSSLGDVYELVERQ